MGEIRREFQRNAYKYVNWVNGSSAIHNSNSACAYDPAVVCFSPSENRNAGFATLLVTTISCVVPLFSSLDVLSSMLSFGTLFIFMLMAVALLVRQYYVKETTSSRDLIKFLVCLFVVIGSSIGITVLWGVNWKGWVAGTGGMMAVGQRRVPKVWGVPLVPWLPALSILMNVFLIGSLGGIAFKRFFICSGVMLVYYFFVGVHATYDLSFSLIAELTIVEEEMMNSVGVHIAEVPIRMVELKSTKYDDWLRRRSE
ncbi:hypothetical protein L2E82_17299 [Cichorium intybus]|uniref:Uncharacterized protein n=1 Tax=Cichorium intybus TaxID=13427 RepID=A0ACB9F8D6_CICIN|nr:hypothetical protein L2E82_17299 [Cichorium intybus]